ncbi:MAG: adenosylcobinamide-GDP ribazoletransferase [Bosea sp. (in: a-proteobacteria)]
MTDIPPVSPTPASPETVTPARFALAVARCVRFYSRLPVPALPGEADPHAIPDFRIEPVGLPVAALVIVLPALLVSLLCAALKLDPLLSAALCVAVLLVSTGAFHEDGLCDCADGLFGGHDVERRLEIMKDSRIGTFAGCALGLSLLLRVAALAAILRGGGLDAMVGALAIAAVVSRVEGVRVLATLPTARAYGASAAVGKPSIRTALFAGGLALALALVLTMVCNLPPWGVLAGLVLGHLMVSVLAGLCRRLIGGQTGDVAGAAQQLAEIGFYVGLAAGLAR